MGKKLSTLELYVLKAQNENLQRFSDLLDSQKTILKQIMIIKLQILELKLQQNRQTTMKEEWQLTSSHIRIGGRAKFKGVMGLKLIIVSVCLYYPMCKIKSLIMFVQYLYT